MRIIIAVCRYHALIGKLDAKLQLIQDFEDLKQIIAANKISITLILSYKIRDGNCS